MGASDSHYIRDSGFYSILSNYAIITFVVGQWLEKRWIYQ